MNHTIYILTLIVSCHHNPYFVTKINTLTSQSRELYYAQVLCNAKTDHRLSRPPPTAANLERVVLAQGHERNVVICPLRRYHLTLVRVISFEVITSKCIPLQMFHLLFQTGAHTSFWF
jgi:hypothetical protein